MLWAVRVCTPCFTNRPIPSSSLQDGSYGPYVRITILSQELHFLARSYSLPGTTLPKKEVKIGEYAIACLGPGTTLPKKKV
jgi:hypothetical protein